MAGFEGFLPGLTLHHRGSLAAAVHELNRAICEIAPDSFYASLFCAWIDAAGGQLHYVNAGHGPVLLLSGIDPPRVRRLENTGTVLGLSLRVGYGQRTVDLQPGDLLLGLSDGVTDALREGEIIHIVESHAGTRAVDVVSHILDAVCETADRAAVAVRFNGRAAARAVEDDTAEWACTGA